jgi:hypothetical protein
MGRSLRHRNRLFNSNQQLLQRWIKKNEKDVKNKSDLYVYCQPFSFCYFCFKEFIQFLILKYMFQKIHFSVKTILKEIC